MIAAAESAADHWQRLRKDKRSNAAVALLLLAGLLAVLSALDMLLAPSRSADRGNPLYWLILLPFAWWGSALGSFTPWAVRSMRVAAIAFPAIAGSALASDVIEHHPLAWPSAAFAAASVSTILCRLMLRGSVLGQAGPDRRP